MKKMTALCLMVMTLAICVPNQALADKGQTTPVGHSAVAWPQSGGKHVIMANTEGDFHIAAPHSKPAGSRSLTVNGGSGNDNLQAKSASTKAAK
jgi:hypothetical protein